ncbi:MAG: EamA family transporter [Bacillota bacterium]
MKNEFLWLISSILLGAIGQCLLKLSVLKMDGVVFNWPNFLPVLAKIFTNSGIISGLIIFAASMILWLKVLSEMELSRAYPSVSLAYLVVFFFSVLFLGEKVTAWKLAGLACIIIGIYFIHH